MQQRNSFFEVASRVLGALALLVLFAACDSDGSNGDVVTFEVEADYVYPPGGEPSITLDMANKDEEIDLSGSHVETSVIGNRVRIRISNVKFRDDDRVYQVDRIITREYSETQQAFIEDSENFLDFASTQSTAIVLVLDVSSSLGEDLQSVKNYAIRFLEAVEDESRGTYTIGVVGFSSFVESAALTTSTSRLTQFISSLPGGRDETKLYQAIDAAVDMLEPVDVDGKGIVIFTDGTNNSWDDEVYSNINYVEQRLRTLEGLSAYTIGFTGKGDVDKTALRRLAIGGRSEFPESARDLEKVFDQFGSTVASLYTFEYNRNASRFSEPRRLKFSFRATEL